MKHRKSKWIYSSIMLMPGLLLMSNSAFSHLNPFAPVNPSIVLAAGTVPDIFAFTPVTGAERNTTIQSAPITVSGLDSASTISIVGGEYSINGNPFTSADGLVNNGDVVIVQEMSSGVLLTPTTATLTIGGVSSDFTVTTTNQFTFMSKFDVPVSTLEESEHVGLWGNPDSPVTVSIIGGEYSLNGGAFTSADGTMQYGDDLVVRQMSSASNSTTTTTTLTLGRVTGTFAVTTVAATDPVDPFAFVAQTNIPLSTIVDSNTITISGTTGPTPISIVGGQYSINGGAFTTAPGTVNNGDTVTVQQTSAATFSTTTTATLTIDGSSADFNVTTLAGDITPDPFSFVPQTGVALNSPINSDTITVSGIDSPSPISISGGQYSINGGAFTTAAGTVNNGDTVAVQVMSSTSPLITTTATLTIDSVNADFNVTTLAPDITPDQFTFVAVTNAPISTLETSAPITVTGINSPSPISIFGGEYSINGGAFTAAPGMVNNGDDVVVRQTSSSSFATTTTATLTIDSVNSDFNVTTQAADITPDQFNIIPQSGVALNTLITSSPITITGINSPSPISITGGQYSINGGAFTNAPGTVNNGDTVAVQVMSAASNLLTTTATLTIDSVNSDFNVTTLGSDITPDQFNFTSQTGVALSSPITSNVITVSGINAPSPISIFGGQYSINGGAFTTAAGTVNNGDTVAVQVMSSASPLITTTATLTIDSVNADFNVTTLGSDTTPDIFSFTNQNNVAVSSQITSNTITVSGINAPSPIQVVNGEYSINGGAFTTAPGTVNNGDTVALRVLSSSNFNTSVTATLIIDGVSSNFKVTTVASSTTAVFDSIPAALDAVLGQPFTFTFHAAKASGAPVTYSLGSNAPSGATIDASTGVFTWTPTALGSFTFDVIASDPTALSVTINVTQTPVVSEEDHHGDNDNECGSYVCRQYHKYAVKYRNPGAREMYLKVKALENSNPREFERLKAVYLKYKDLSHNEILALPAKTQADFMLYKKYNGVKHYRHFKERL